MTDDRVRTAVAALQNVPPPVDWRDVERHLAQPTPEVPNVDGESIGRRTGLRVVVCLGLAAAVVASAIVLWPDSRPDSVRTTRPTGQTNPPTSPPPAVDGDTDTSTSPPAAQTLRSDPVVAVAGGEYLVWGGEAEASNTPLGDGFSVNIGTGAVRPIPAAPIDPRAGATGVWTGTELIVCCGTGQADGFNVDTRSAAAWNPATGAWRTLSRPPATVARSFPASVWTGELMVVMATGPAVAIYDPGTDTWSERPTPRAIDGEPEAAWTGAEVILWDRRYGSGRVPPDGAVADQGWRWAPGEATWERLPDLPPGSRTQLGSMVWTGSDLVVWGESTSVDGLGVGARWRPGDDTWTPVAPSPQGRVSAFDGTPGSQSVASDPERNRVLVRGLDGGDAVPPTFLYDPERDTWTNTGLQVAGYHPSLALADGQVFAPNGASPIVGPTPN